MNQNELLLWSTCILNGFILGSVLFSQLIPQFFLQKDICAVSDDHNPGASNVFASCGIFWGLLCLSLDITKGFWPVFLGLQILQTNHLLFAAVIVAPVLGHATAPFNHFRGGKCIATSFGVLLGLFSLTNIVLLLAGIYIIFSTIFKISSTRLRSIASFSLFGILSAIILFHTKQNSIALGCLLISSIVVVKHLKIFASA
jgi:glycerol-3-phosphate acyltransferase PlsY